MKPIERPKIEKNGEQWLPDHPWCPNGQLDYGISEVSEMKRSHTNDFKTGTPMATLRGAWRYGIGAGTGWPASVYCDWVRLRV